ncbi:hypothetical protein [Priestia megaterium]|uniref:hypothetical protein n=1 Tax=Priestia megaterium TaxID=1404 RepID=UPI003872BC8D|nr:hypothetical protein QY062_24620 [Priestia megaterium]
MSLSAINFKEMKEHESFSNIGEMNKSIYDYIEHIRKDVPQSVIDVLLCLGRSSLRLVGLSFKKQATIANETGYSRKTINKALKILEALGVIDSVRTQTKAGRPSVKIIRILPFCLERLQQGVTSDEADHFNNDAYLKPIENFEPIVQETSKDYLKEDRKAAIQDDIDLINVEELGEEFIPSNIVPIAFKMAVIPFFRAYKVFRLWGIVRSAMKQNRLSTVNNDSMEATLEAFRTTVFMYKAKRLNGSFENYFFGVLRSMLGAVKRRQVKVNSGIFSFNMFE